MNKEIYFEKLRRLRDEYLRSWKPHSDPYQYVPNGNIREILNKVEFDVWQDIRCVAIPLYPQWPADRFFIDFADPVKKIGVEVDGKIHSRPDVVERDLERTKILESLGWKIYRIPAAKTFKYRSSFFTDEFLNDLDYMDSEERKVANLDMEELYEAECSEGILRKIKRDNYSGDDIFVNVISFIPPIT